MFSNFWFLNVFRSPALEHLKKILKDTVLTSSIRDGDGVAPSTAISWMVLLVPASVPGLATREQKQTF